MRDARFCVAKPERALKQFVDVDGSLLLLSILLASVLLLAIAFALGTPGLKQDGSPDKSVASRITTR
jgi:hypothetical protein